MTTIDMILFTIVFVGVALAGYGLMNLMLQLVNGGGRRIERRLQRTERTEAERLSLRAAVQARLQTEPGGWPFKTALTKLALAANVNASPAMLVAIMAAIGGAVSAVLIVAAPIIPAPLSVVLGAPVGVGVVMLSLTGRQRKRMRAFQDQLPEALDIIVRGLRIGMPISATLDVVARDMPDPIATEFRRCFEEVNYGQSLNEALSQMYERLPLQDLRYFTVAVHIQSESGGNLSEVLSGLAKVIRDRFRMMRKVKAITTEGRMSAWFLTLFPFAIVGFIQLVKPDYYTQVMDYAYFPHLAVVVALLLLVNFVAMKIITTIKV